MGRNNYFQFKQFRIVQEKAAMKVGTDGVLLGAWAEVADTKTVLDVGTGTGLIALMMTQRTSAKITGIEIEKDAASEAIENVKNSPWKDRINIENISFQEFVKSASQTFDLIVSNPPFFINDKKTKNQNLTIAKHNDLLPLDDLSEGAAKLLEPDGKLALILPVKTAEKFIELANPNGIFLNRLTKVRPTNLKPVHRYLMEFSKIQTAIEKDWLTIHEDDLSDFSEKYKQITREFYLHF